MKLSISANYLHYITERKNNYTEELIYHGMIIKTHFQRSFFQIFFSVK